MVEILTVNDRKFVVKERIYLSRFQSQESADTYLKGRLYLRNNNNPDECILVSEIGDAKFTDITGSQEPEKKELGSIIDAKV